MRLSSAAISPKLSRPPQLDAMFEVATGDFVGIGGQHPDGMQHEHDGRHFNKDEGDEERDGEVHLTGCSQCAMGCCHQPHGERGDHDTAENQPLREIQHLPGSAPVRTTLSFLRTDPQGAKRGSCC